MLPVRHEWPRQAAEARELWPANCSLWEAIVSGSVVSEIATCWPRGGATTDPRPAQRSAHSNSIPVQIDLQIEPILNDAPKH